MGTSETETREHCMVTLCALDTSTLYDGLTDPPVWRIGCRQAQLWCRVVLARESWLPWHAMYMLPATLNITRWTPRPLQK